MRWLALLPWLGMHGLPEPKGYDGVRSHVVAEEQARLQDI